MMAGFYIRNNAGIGLRCFAWGIVFGLGSLNELLFEGIYLGAVFGYMATRPHAINFLHVRDGAFVVRADGDRALRRRRTAHGLGAGRHQGQSRLASLRREAATALPAVGAAVVLFVLAAVVEGYHLGVASAVLEQGRRGDRERPASSLYLTLGGRASRSEGGAVPGRAAARLISSGRRQGEEPWQWKRPDRFVIAGVLRTGRATGRPCTRSRRSGATARAASSRTYGLTCDLHHRTRS